MTRWVSVLIGVVGVLGEVGLVIAATQVDPPTILSGNTLVPAALVLATIGALVTVVWKVASDRTRAFDQLERQNRRLEEQSERLRKLESMTPVIESTQEQVQKIFDLLSGLSDTQIQRIRT